MTRRAILALEDGRVFEGEGFGAETSVCGEACFNTSMTGYQEVLTDPSYRGQIVAMTYPLIGNYGTNALDEESKVPHVRGFVVGELSAVPSSWRNEVSLEDYLKLHGIPGIEGVDTRALTRHLRTRGAMKACLATGDISADQAVEMARGDKGVVGVDYVKEVTAAKGFEWDPEGTDSIEWGSQDGPAPVRHRVVAYDLGMKRNILRELRRQGFGVHVVPATATAEDVLALNPDGIFLSNGPGDPAALDYVHESVRGLIVGSPGTELEFAL